MLLSSPQSRAASSRRHQQWGQTCMEQAYMGWVPQPEENTAANGITCSTQTRREHHCLPAAPAAASAAAAAQQQQRQLCGKLAGHSRNDGENQLRQGQGHGQQGTGVGSAGTVGSSRQKLMGWVGTAPPRRRPFTSNPASLGLWLPRPHADPAQSSRPHNKPQGLPQGPRTGPPER